MTRRRFIALISLCMLVVLGLIGVVVGLVATRSESGQAELRAWVERGVASSMHGKLHIGRMSGNFITGSSYATTRIRSSSPPAGCASSTIRATSWTAGCTSARSK
jgi:hypothetical protein